MSNANYLIRLDDACPTMDKQKWQRMEEILDQFHIKPLVGIIPDNHDPDLMINDYDPLFWNKVRAWQKKGWAIAMHGYDHVYLTEQGGINPIHKHSEFAGLDLEQQRGKIKLGIKKMQSEEVYPRCFFAPSHTFDLNTLEALRLESNIEIISDTFARFPYKMFGFIFIPQQFGAFRVIKFGGIWTFCLHPNSMDDAFFEQCELFLNRNQSLFLSFDLISTWNLDNKSAIDSILSLMYFAKRYILRILRH
jgi:predicted deacetylase